MRIVFDAFWWAEGPPSGKNVVRSIVDQWITSFPGDSVICWSTPAGTREIASQYAGAVNVRTIAVKSPQHLLALQATRPSGDVDALVTQNFSPLRTRKAVSCVFFHDALVQARPEWFTRKERVYLGVAARLLRHADIIFTSSTSEASRIQKLTSARPGTVHAVGLGLPADFAAAPESRPSLAVERGQYFLTVGRINVRKNVGSAVSALRQDHLISGEHPLVIVGAPDGMADAALTSGTQDDLVFTGFIPNGELRWLYRNCAAFIFPSLDEGFGLPVLEAVDCGSSIALSDIPSFREFGPVGHFFDPNNLPSIATAVREAASQQTDGHGPVLKHNWDDVVHSMRSAIEQAMGGVRR